MIVEKIDEHTTHREVTFLFTLRGLRAFGVPDSLNVAIQRRLNLRLLV